MGFAKTHFGMIWQKWRLCELRAICLADLVDGVVHAQVALLDPDRALADALDHAGGEVLHGHVHEVGQLGEHLPISSITSIWSIISISSI